MTMLAPELNLPPEHPLRQILNAIAAHPEVREPVLRILLTEKFLALPEQVDKLSSRVEDLTGQVQELRGDFNDFREETREQFSSINQRIDENTRRLDETNQRLDETTRRLDENIRITRRLEGHVGRLVGASYEDLCRAEIDSVLDEWLDRPVLADRERISALLQEARWNNEISRSDYLDGRRADIIARAFNDENHSGPLAVVESSVTFNRNDLQSAARRAEVIGRVLGVATAAFVVTNNDWPPEVGNLAQQLGVTIIRHEAPEFTET